MVELLVSLSIIGVLAGVVFPTFGTAREQGRRARCIGNLKQIGAAMMMYYDDWDFYPRDLDALREAHRLPDELFICPSDAKRGKRPEWHVRQGRTRPLSYSTYAFLCPETPYGALFYGLWLPNDPLAGPLAVCDHHRADGQFFDESKDLGVYADGHVAWCSMYVKDHGDWREGSYWPIFLVDELQ
jgi:hypothetical protein